MKIAIFGVGRSGTTAIYSLLQKILDDVYPDDTDYVYEPFLWDRKTFNVPYTDIDAQFNCINSLHIDGMYFHQKLPLLIEKTDKFYPNSFIDDLLTPRDSKSNLLLKTIRSCGRIKLFAESAPDAKIIYITRNPVDTVNSVFPLFSFYGGEFHKDDLDRFLKEVNFHFSDNLSADALGSFGSKQAVWWYYMNAFALDSLNDADISPLVLSHERFVSSPENCTEEICSYLGLSYKEKYNLFSKKRVGPVSTRRYLSQEDIEYLLTFNDHYRTLLSKFNIQYPADYSQNMLNRYRNANVSVYTRSGYGITANVLGRQAVSCGEQLDEVRSDLDEAKRQLALIRATFAYKVYSSLKQGFRYVSRMFIPDK